MPEPSFRPSAAVVAVWLLLSAAASLPYVLAERFPPPGKAFQGFFVFIDDHYLYLSYAQQAEDGAFLFRNKLVTQDHPPALVNLEWWTVGRLSRLFGSRPFLAYRVFGVLASLLLFAVLARMLLRAGLPERRLFVSLLLIGTGGGIGGILAQAGVLPLTRATDAATGLFPFLGLLGNAHFTIATALFLASLLAFESASPRSQAVGVLLGSALGLTRPYDLVLLVGIRGARVLLGHGLREWPRRLAGLFAFLPVVAWNYWTFYANPAFSFYAKAPYAFPPASEVALALAPAALFALSSWRSPAPTEDARGVRMLLLLWTGFGLMVVVLRPVYFSLQFLMGIGVPLLAFAALGLARIGAAASWLAVATLGTTFFAMLATLLQPLPYWFTPKERLETARALRPLCRVEDVVFAPADIGLFVAGLSACKAYVSHVSHPEYSARKAEAIAFYESQDPEGRAALLDRGCIRHLVLPGNDGDVPARWLPETTAFRRAAVVGTEPALISVYSRAPVCGP